VSYSIGFVFCIALTLGSFALVQTHALPPNVILLAILIFAVAQLFVQLLFFLHVGREPRPRWHFIALTFAILLVAILVFGSLWIMSNLRYNTMSPAQTDTYMMNQ
jgi:cytochrome o ubiquinol oxidase operon protein cyoD